MPADTAPPCRYRIEGNADGPTLVFIHGWPDDDSLWRKQVAGLGDEFRCVLVTLPNFGEHAERAGGYDFPELVERLHATVRAVQPEGAVGLVTHDWGAYLGYMLEQKYPQCCRRMVALDIGGHFEAEGLKPALMIIGYQWGLIAAWLAGGVVPPLGDLLAKGVGKAISVPARQRERLRSRYGYPYFYMWRNLLLPGLRKRLLGAYRPRCPVLYLYGKRKPFMLHSDKWLRIVAETGGQAEGLANAGHWLMETQADTVNGKIRKWMSEPGPA